MHAVDPIEYILTHLRERDAEEIAACGHKAEDIVAALRELSVFSQVWASEKTNKPAAFLAFSEMTPVTLYASMLATDDWPDVAGQVVRSAGTIRSELLRKNYRRAECRTMEGHDAAIRFLEHLGFKLEARIPDYGLNGAAFLQYAWSLDDHVLQAPAVRQ